MGGSKACLSLPSSRKRSKRHRLRRMKTDPKDGTKCSLSEVLVRLQAPEGARARGAWGEVGVHLPPGEALKGCHGPPKASRGLHPFKSAAFREKTILSRTYERRHLAFPREHGR